MKIMFMGTPDLAKECLRQVFEKDGVEIVGVVTRADKQKGRGMKFVYSPVKEFALEKELPVYQPITLRDGEFQEVLDELQPELIIVAAYGNILPKYVLDYPKYGCINAHGSLLPKYRGASPIQRAIIDGETETGITAMYMEEGLDTGDMILKLVCPITEDDDFGTLHDKLASLAGKAMCDVIDLINSGNVPREKQDDSLSCYAAKIEKEDTIADFTRSPREMVNLIRGLSPAPCVVTKTPDGKLLKLPSAYVLEGECDKQPGTVIELDTAKEGKIVISCGGGLIAVTSVTPEGKKRMAAADYIRGRKINVGDVLKY
ncbi:MAG: methionyl-tRNA formyltransferase [Clostridia bacterium]|nr:methionyl-tRNA formyltransferase [Clostridia bacterium]